MNPMMIMALAKMAKDEGKEMGQDAFNEELVSKPLGYQDPAAQQQEQGGSMMGGALGKLMSGAELFKKFGG